MTSGDVHRTVAKEMECRGYRDELTAVGFAQMGLQSGNLGSSLTLWFLMGIGLWD